MNTTTTLTALTVLLGLTVCAKAPSNWSHEPGARISFNETPVVTAEFDVSFDSRYMTYGVIDGKATSVFWAEL